MSNAVTATMQKKTTDPPEPRPTREFPRPEGAKEYFLWCDQTCPNFAPTVCGQDFPKYIEVRTDRDPRTKKFLPPSRQRRRAWLSPDTVEKIRRQLAEPFKTDNAGYIVSGVGAYDPDLGRHADIAPYLHIEPVEPEISPASDPAFAPMAAWLEEMNKLRARKNKLAQRAHDSEVGDAEKKKINAEIEKINARIVEITDAMPVVPIGGEATAASPGTTDTDA